MLGKKPQFTFIHQLDTNMKMNLKKLENWWDNTGFAIYLVLLVMLFFGMIIKMYTMGVHTWD
jgi:hypothetical protein